jgi:hypothetical protein
LSAKVGEQGRNAPKVCRIGVGRFARFAGFRRLRVCRTFAAVATTRLQDVCRHGARPTGRLLPDATASGVGVPEFCAFRVSGPVRRNSLASGEKQGIRFVPT